jgi:hypothetical protein
MNPIYEFECVYEGIMWPVKDGKIQINEEPEISFTINYKRGLDIQDVTKRLINNFVESIDAWARCDERDKLKRGQNE